jgi:hypothetical protein
VSDPKQSYFNVYSGKVYAPLTGSCDADDDAEMPGKRLGLRSGAGDRPTSAETSGLNPETPLPFSSFPPASVTEERRARKIPLELPASARSEVFRLLSMGLKKESGASETDPDGATAPSPCGLFKQADAEKKKQGHCGTMTLIGTARERTGDKRQMCFRRLNCKCWDCARCGKRKAKRYRRAIMTNAEKLQLRRFVTLTLDPAKVVGDPVAYLRGCWAKLRTYCRRKFGPGVQFISVLEWQQNGTPHLHLLVDRWIEWKWLQNVWEALGGGHFVNIKFVDLHRVAAYLSKYLTKELLLSAPKGTRRITSSRHIQLLEKPPSSHEWSMKRVPILSLFERYSAIATAIEFDNDVGLISFNLEVT